MNSSELDSLARLYVLGLLPPADRAAVESALPRHAELARRVAEMQHSRAENKDSAGLARLMGQVQTDETQRDRVAANDPGLREDLIELLALYEAMGEKLAALAAVLPDESSP